MRRLRLLFVVSRPLSWINTAFPFFIVYFALGKPWDLTATIGTLFFLIPYNLAMYGINDVFDYESDIRNPRKGGVEGAVVNKADHAFVLKASVLLAIPFVAYLYSAGSNSANLMLTVSLFAVLAYSWRGLRFKEKPFLDSITSATHFVSPAAYSMLLLGGSIAQSQWLILVAFLLWGIASHAFGAVQDILSDREGGISSIATFLGASWTVRFAAFCYLLSGLILIFLPPTASWVAPAAGLYIAAISPWLSCSDADSEKANRGWKFFLYLNFFAGAAVSFAVIAYRILIN